jgi:WD40 repeat protein/predicted Ser/Thr protein kinase
VLETPQSATEKPVLPRAFGAYELLEEVARGGMGIVFKARQSQLNRVVAVKVMAAGQFAAPDFVKRFRTETEAVASLDHPNIVPIYEVGECEGQPFFSMRFIEGGSLAGRISNRGFQISEGEAAGLLAKLARAVHYAHQRGILHRDIKPGNILLDAQGEPFLTDFGLAKLVDKESTLTRTMAMLGTPSYMSPEQARGEAKQLTTAVDVYGLGAVFYELLTGQPPFAGGTTMETVRQVLEKEPRRPSALKPVDRDLETICLKCLEKDAAHRYGSAEALADDFERWQRNEPVVARPPSALYMFQKAWRRNKLAYLAGIAVVVALLFGLGMASVAWRKARKEQTLAAQQRDLAQERLYDSLVREARSIGIIRPLGYRAELFDRIRQALAIPSAKKDLDVLRSEAAQCLGDAMSLSPVILADPPRAISDLALDTEGRQAVCGTVDGKLVVYETATGSVVSSLTNQGQVLQLLFGPDDRSFFGFVRASGEQVGGNAPQKLLVEWQRVEDGSWSRKSERAMPNLYGLTRSSHGVLAAIEDKQELQLMEAATERVVGSVPLAPDAPFLAAFAVTFDASLVALSGAAGANQFGNTVDVWDLAAKQRRIRLTPGPGEVRYLEFSRDGRFLACMTGAGVVVYETSEFKPVTTYRGYSAARVTWVGDGTILAVPLSQENAVRLFAVTSGSELTRLTTRGQLEAIRASMDGSVLAAKDIAERVLVARLADGRERLRLIGHGGGVPAVEFSPDGKWIASSGKDQTIKLWDSVTGKLLQNWKAPHAEGQTIGFSPDGRWLASGNYRDNQIVVWSVEDGQQLLMLGGEGTGGSGTWSCNFSPDSKILLAVGDGLRAWELRPRSAGVTDPQLEAHQLFTTPGDFRNLQIDPMGKWVGFQGNLRRNGEAVSGSFIMSLKSPTEPELTGGPDWSVQTLGIADNGRTLLSLDRAHTLHFWDLQSRRFVRALPTLAQGESALTYVGNLRVSPDGSKVAIANHSGLGVNIYDLSTGRRRCCLPDETGSIWWLAWHPDNRHLAVSRGNGEISLWNLAEVEAVLAKAGLAP